MSEKEIWAPIPGCQGVYEASTFGRLRSVDRTEVQKNGVARRRKGRILIPSLKKSGYLCLHFSICGKLIEISVHKAIATTFIPNPQNLPCINHKDRDKTNNRVDNLEWCTYEYNNKYSNVSRYAAMGRRRKIAMLSEDGAEIKRFDSITEASISTGASIPVIVAAASGRQKHGGGYKWKYI